MTLAAGRGACSLEVHMAGMYRMNDLLKVLAHEDAEEVHLESGRPPVMVLRGKSRVLDGGVITSDNVAELFHGIATEEQRRELEQCGDTHFVFSSEGLGRFSLRATVQGESLSLLIKNISRQ